MTSLLTIDCFVWICSSFIQGDSSQGVGFSGNGTWESQVWRREVGMEAIVHERPAAVWGSGQQESSAGLGGRFMLLKKSGRTRA